MYANPTQFDPAKAKPVPEPARPTWRLTAAWSIMLLGVPVMAAWWGGLAYGALLLAKAAGL